MSGETLTYAEIQSLMKLMNIPAAYQDVSKSLIPQNLDKILTGYMSKFHDLKKRGIGLIVSGPNGAGKTSAAIYLAKVVKMMKNQDLKPYSCYFIRAFELREKYRKSRTIDGTTELVYDRCRNVDFLVLDNLAQEDADLTWPGPRMYAELIIARYMEGKPTVITTNLSKKEFSHYFRELSNSIGGYLHFLVIDGEDQRKKKSLALAAELEEAAENLQTIAADPNKQTNG